MAAINFNILNFERSLMRMLTSRLIKWTHSCSNEETLQCIARKWKCVQKLRHFSIVLSGIVLIYLRKRADCVHQSWQRALVVHFQQWKGLRSINAMYVSNLFKTSGPSHIIRKGTLRKSHTIVNYVTNHISRLLSWTDIWKFTILLTIEIRSTSV